MNVTEKMSRAILGLCLFGLVCASEVAGQMDYGRRLGLQQGGEALLVTQSPEVSLNALDPAVRRWYVPQELYGEYPWRQWQYTSRAHEPYDRYVALDLEGDYFYDLYGNYLTQGWLIFNTAQRRPEEAGSTLFKTQRFARWFNELVIAGDNKGQYHYALTVSNNLRTTLTPLSFSKPRLNGFQLDLATDKYQLTFLHSLITGPRGLQVEESRFTDATSLVGGRFTAQLGDFVELGLHAVNAHQTSSESSELVSTLYRGGLTEQQNQTVSQIVVVLRDDSPADGTGGAAFFPDASDVLITYRDGTVESGNSIRFEPVISGGLKRQGFLTADGNGQISLLYDFDSPAYVNRAAADKSEIVAVEFRLVLANDYQIWMSSDRQQGEGGGFVTVGRPSNAFGGGNRFNPDGTERTISLGDVFGADVDDPVFLMVAQADGNVQDISNLRTVTFAYGLPTATSIAGGTLQVDDVLGFDFYGEYDLSWSFRQYPNVAEETHVSSSGIGGRPSAPAWMVNVSKRWSEVSFFGEAYSIDPRYNTQSFVTTTTGLDYARQGSRFDLVEDNDDQDRFPDAFRADFLVDDRLVFPGWDLNNDLVPDFNQNDNRVKANSIPDYEEPFLRFQVDRPEFLFGVDMNHNFWVDQYENDTEPDYPYRRDQAGFNFYGGIDLTESWQIKAGALREEQLSADRRNHSTYVQLSFDRAWPGWGRVRLFEMGQLVRDDIPDPLLQWQPDNTLRGGQLASLADPLLARDTWVNQLFVGHSMTSERLQVMNKLNWVMFQQRLDADQRRVHNLPASDFFFGLINKASYRRGWAGLVLEPRWKSEFIKQSRSLFARRAQTTLMELLSVLLETQLLQATRLQAGMEYAWFNDFDADVEDFNSLSWALQLATESAYLGYRIQALAGFVVERKAFTGAEAVTTTETFVTLYAGLQ